MVFLLIEFCEIFISQKMRNFENPSRKNIFKKRSRSVAIRFVGWDTFGGGYIKFQSNKLYIVSFTV